MSKLKTVGFYLRVSTRHQDIPEGSLKSQQQRLQEWFDYQNRLNQNSETGEGLEKYDKTKIYKDVESGSSKAKRYSYQAMLIDIKMNKLSAIICTSISRLNRNLREFYDLMDICNDYGVDIISLKENFDTSTAIGRALLKFMLVFYELESEQTSDRNKDNRYARFKRGLWLTSTILGYENPKGKKGHLTPIPEEVELINNIFDLYIVTGSISKVQEILDKEGQLMPARKLTGSNKGKRVPIHDGTIRRILKNKAYIGINQWKKDNINKTEITKPGEKYEETEGVWKGIVTNEKFYQAQEILTINRQKRSNQVVTTKKVYELTEVIKCGICKNKPNMRVDSGTSKTKKVYKYYVCKNCGKRVNAEFVEKAVISQFSLLAGDSKLISSLLDSANEKYIVEASSIRERIKQLAKEQDAINESIDEEIEKLASVKDSEFFKDRIRQKEREFKERLGTNIKEENSLNQKLEILNNQSFKPENIAKIFENFSSLAEILPPLVRRKVIQFAVSDCLVGEDYVMLNISEQIINLPLNKEKAAVQKEFTTTAVERDRRDSNSRPLA